MSFCVKAMTTLSHQEPRISSPPGTYCPACQLASPIDSESAPDFRAPLLLTLPSPGPSESEAASFPTGAGIELPGSATAPSRIRAPDSPNCPAAPAGAPAERPGRPRAAWHRSCSPASAFAQPSDLTTASTDWQPGEPIERAATLEDARAEVLTPHRLNSLVFGIFAAVALSIAAVGVAGVLAFSVSARTREFGIRLALGSQPRDLLKGVIAEGVAMAAVGIVAGAALGFVLARVARSYFEDARMPGALPVAASALVLLTVAVVASMLPAARAARGAVIQALHSE